MHQVLMTTLSAPHHQWYLMKMENTLYLHLECTSICLNGKFFIYFKAFQKTEGFLLSFAFRNFV